MFNEQPHLDDVSMHNVSREQSNEEVGNKSEGVGLSDYTRRRNRELKNLALEPLKSFNRFKESLTNSSMPESLKERFRNLK